MESTYLRFLTLVHALDGSSPAKVNVDETAKQLLNMIAVKHDEGKSMSVSEAMALGSIASPATIHRKLNNLLEFGLIEQTFAANNRRTKYLAPTKATNNYFETLGEAMKQSISII